ncbi:MAG TPA: hypothetical protein VMI56_14505 [Reyranella sp.]|nr:hypothetical protein [Reyranella sp.]
MPSDPDFWLKAASAIVAAIGAAAGLLTYSRAQRWKRVEYLVAQFAEMRRDEKAAIAMRLLDYGRSYIALPFKLPDSDTTEKLEAADGKGHLVAVGSSKLTFALIPHNQPELPPKQPLHDYVRLCIDEFLIRLGVFNALKDLRLANQEELDTVVGYWLETVAGKTKAAEGRKDVFLALRWYIQVYGFENVRDLALSFDLDLSITEEEKRALLERVSRRS